MGSLLRARQKTRENRGVYVEPRHDTEDLRAAAARHFPQEGGEAREKVRQRRGDRG